MNTATCPKCGSRYVARGRQQMSETARKVAKKVWEPRRARYGPSGTRRKNP